MIIVEKELNDLNSNEFCLEYRSKIYVDKSFLDFIGDSKELAKVFFKTVKNELIRSIQKQLKEDILDQELPKFVKVEEQNEEQKERNCTDEN